MGKANFTNIIVVQSLSESESRTGTALVRDVKAQNEIYERGLSIDIVDIDTGAEFLRLIDSLTKAAYTHGIVPILHIECHGYNDGFAFNRDGLDWRELTVPFAGLNRATRFNLTVVAAACHGARLGYSISPTDEAPLWAFVGPTDKLLSSDLLRSFSTFYKVLLDTGDCSEAVALMNADKSQEEPAYYLDTAENMFRLAYQRYIADHCTAEKFLDRAEYISAELKRRCPACSPKPEQISKILSNRQREFFERFHNRFFMIGDFPENAQRFRMRFEDITIEVSRG